VPKIAGIWHLLLKLALEVSWYTSLHDRMQPLLETSLIDWFDPSIDWSISRLISWFHGYIVRWDGAGDIQYGQRSRWNSSHLLPNRQQWAMWRLLASHQRFSVFVSVSVCVCFCARSHFLAALFCWFLSLPTLYVEQGLWNDTVSVCPVRPLQQHALGLLLWPSGQEISSVAVIAAAASVGTVMLSVYIRSWTQTCCICVNV